MLIGAIALWSTDLIHHISPGSHSASDRFAGNCAGVGVGQEDLKRLNYSSILHPPPPISLESLGSNAGPQTQ